MKILKQKSKETFSNLASLLKSFEIRKEQGEDLKNSIKSVPTIIIFRNGKPIARLEAGLSMKIETKLEDIQELVDRYQ